eukprot:Pgem_evm1s15550
MISGCMAHKEWFEQGVEYFEEFKALGTVKPDNYHYSPLIHACSRFNRFRQ